MATFGNEFINSKASTDVNVVGFAGNALDGILKAIQATKEATEDLADKIEENGDQQGKKDAKDKVASVASERRQRAANAAIHGKIDKGFTLMGLVQKSLEKIASYVGDIATRTMKSLDDSVRTQRKLILSSAQIVANQKTASRIAGEVRNYGVSPNDVRKMTDALAEQGVLATDLSDKQLQLVAVAMHKNNVSAEKALSLALQSRGEEDSMIKTLIQATDLTGRKTTETMLSKLDSSVFQIYAKSVGGMNQAISSYNEFAKQLDSNFGMYMGAEAQTTVLESFIKYQSNQIEKLTDEELKAIQGLGINAKSSPEEIVEQIKSGLQNNKFDESNVKVLRSIEGFGEEFANSLLEMQNAFNKDGNLQTKKIRPEQENIDAAKASVEGGTVGNWLSNAFTKLDVVSGGLFSGISTQLNEWFGEDASLEGVVTKGFPVVIGLLGAIAASSLISKGGELLKSLAGLGGLGGLTGLGGAANAARGVDAASDATRAASAASAARGVKLAKFAKGAGVVGAAISVGVAGYEISKAIEESKKSTAEKENSAKFKKEERKLREEQRNNKIAGEGLKLAAVGAGALAGAKLGAALGSVVPGAGNVLGGIAGAAIGGVAGPIVDHFVKASENLKESKINEKKLEDLEKRAKILQGAIEIETDLKKKEELIALKANTDALIANTKKEIKEKNQAHWDEMTGGKTSDDLLGQLRDTLNESVDTYNSQWSVIASIEKKLNEAKAAKADERKINKLELDLQDAKAKQDDALNTSYKVRLALMHSTNEDLSERGSTIDEILEKIHADAKGGWFDAHDKHKWDAQFDDDKFNEQLKLQLMGNLFKGSGDNEIRKRIGTMSDRAAYEFVREQATKRGMTNESKINDLIRYAFSVSGKKTEGFDLLVEEMKSVNENTKATAENVKDPAKFELVPNAHGGIYNNFTPAVIGEAGKEAVVPLERPEDMRRVLSTLSSSEKFKLIKALLSTKSKKLTWDLLSNVMLKTLGIGSFGPTAQEKSEYDAALAKLDAWQGGKLKPADFIAMFGPIAREDMRATGIPAAITIAQAALESGWGKTAKSDFRNLFGIKGKGDAGSKIIPTHEYNAAGIRYNKRDTFAQYSSYLASINAHSQYLLTAKRKKGLNGLRYGEALLYTDDSDMFARKLKECGYATSPTYAEKLIGLMRQHDMYRYNISSSAVRPGSTLNHIKNSTDFKAASAAKSTTNGTVNTAQGILSDTEIKEILSAAGVSNATTMKQYIEYAKLLVGNANSKDDIITVLLEIARYLKGIAASPANKPPMMSVTRPYTPAYGT